MLNGLFTNDGLAGILGTAEIETYMTSPFVWGIYKYRISEIANP